MLTDQECFEKLLQELRAMPDEQVRSPDRPIEKTVEDGEKMVAALVQDIERFAAIGLPVDIVVRLSEAVAALRVAETHYHALSLERQEALSLWKGKLPAGQRLRRELLAAQTYAFRKFSTPLQRLSLMGHDQSPAGTIHELAQLAQLGREHRELLTQINFDLSVLDLSARQAEELDGLYARISAAFDGNEARQLRDRAFSLVRRIMTEICEAARYVLRNDPVRLTVYYGEPGPQQPARGAAETAMSAPVQ